MPVHMNLVHKCTGCQGRALVPNIFVGKDQTFRKRDALTFRNVMGLQITACAALCTCMQQGEVEFP